MATYEENKARYGVQRARQMEQEAQQTQQAPAPPPPPPPAPGSNVPRPGGAPPPPPPPSSNVPNMSGFQGAGGYDRWAAANRAAGGTGDRAAYDRSMMLYRGGAAPAGPGAPPAPPPSPGAPPAPGGQQPLNLPPPRHGHAQSQFQAAGSPGGQANFQAWFEANVRAGVMNPDGSPRQGVAGAASREMEGVGHSGFNPQTGQYGPPPSDVSGMRAYAREHGMSEDFDRFDEATLMLWESKKDPNCPPKFPYQADNGTGCAEKPIDTGLNGGGGAGGAGGGGGRGGRGGAGGGSTVASSGLGGNAGAIGNTIWDQIQRDLLGGESRYDEEAMARLEADQFARARRQEELQLEESRRDAALRGTSRAGEQGAALRGIRSGTGQQIMANRAQIQQEKIKADFEDRQAAIQNSLNYLNSLREYMLRSDMNSIQRESLAAQIAMAEKQLRWQTAENDRAYQRNLSTYALTNGPNPF